MELQIADQNMLISQQASELEAVKDMVSKIEKTARIQDAKELVDNKGEVEGVEAIGKETKDITDEVANDTRVYFTAYKVESGDNLSSICQKYNLDYAANYRIILSMNGIEDANQIYVGQTILIPIQKDDDIFI